MFKVRKADRIAIHGHRGSRGTHPENTLPAFQEARDAGADFFEVDLHLSADNIPIVFHDAYLSNRLCLDENGIPVQTPIPVRTLTAAELAKYECGSILQPSFPNQLLLPKTPIPTLEQVLDWMNDEAPNLGINIEIKMEATDRTPLPDADFFASRVVDLIYRYGMVNRALVQSFDFRVLTEAKKIDSNLTVSCLFEKQVDFVAEAKKVGASAIGPYYEFLTPQLIERAHAAGLEVLPWTVNTESAWEKLIRFGVDGIITDYPRALQSYLKG